MIINNTFELEDLIIAAEHQLEDKVLLAVDCIIFALTMATPRSSF